MKNRFVLILINLLLSFSITAFSQSAHIKTGNVPKWATDNSINYSSDQLNGDAEDGMVNMDYEDQVSLSEKSVFHRTAIKILTEAGVQSNSQITVNFDPSYQELIFHSLKVIRGKEVIDQLVLSKIKTVHQEKNLQKFIYNGSVSAIRILDDVRMGDVIEYSYTIKGFNPIFNNKYADTYSLQFAVPIYNVYYKLILPANRTILTKNSHTFITPVITKSATETIYEWKAKDVPELTLQDNTPAWFDPYPSVMVSEYKSWKEVNDLVRVWFPDQKNISAPLQNKINDIYKSSSSPEGRVAAALRFVQDEVRYMGIEIGENSHKPHSPDQVFNQRFGDCKDKSYLLHTMLQKMGIKSNLVLINSENKNSITGWLPAAGDFDHMTIRVQLNNDFFWFDPTISYQRGELKNIFYPDYQKGLVLTDTTTSLCTIPFHSNSDQKIKEVFTVKNMEGGATLVVTTDYTGSFADDTRDNYKSSSLNDIQKNYLKMYASYFDKIKADSLTYTDDESTGMFTTKEYYTINNFWGANNNFKKASFEPYVINSLLNKPKDYERSMPYSISYPAKYKEEIEVHLPENWSAKSSSERTICSSFDLMENYSSIGKTLFIKYNYESFKDHVTADEAPDYISKIKKIESHIAYEVSKANMNEGSKANSFTGQYPSLYLALGLCIFITYMVRRKRNTNEKESNDDY